MFVVLLSADRQVYMSTPFKLRKGLHKEAAKWISDRYAQHSAIRINQSDTLREGNISPVWEGCVGQHTSYVAIDHMLL